MRKLFLLLMVLLPYTVFSQKAIIDFKETSHHFGTIKEQDGKVTHEFTFQNTGKAPLLVKNVRSGCGCTVVEWSRKPIVPGEKGSIKVIYDPRNRPGSFIKSITVNSNAQNSVLSLTIRGKVSAEPKGPYSNYEFFCGPLRMEAGSMNLGNIKNTQIPEKTIEIVNTEDQAVTLSALAHSPHLTINFIPGVLQKGEKGKIQVKYDTQQKNDWGFVTDEFKVKTNDKEGCTIMVVANISEDFSFYDGNFDKAPVLTLPESQTTLSGLTKNSPQKHEFFIENIGKSPLIIRKIKTSDNHVTANVAKNVIKPGKKVKVHINFDMGNTDTVIKLIQFISNDPHQPMVTYKIIGNAK